MSTRTTAPQHNLSFGGIIRSEWVKLISIPSTLWAYAAIFVLSVGVIAQMSATTNFDWLEGGLSQIGMQAAGVNAVMLSTDLGSFAVSVLGVLVIAGEYNTGMIRSTFIAVPQRVPALLAKFLVFAVVTLLVAAVAVAIAIPISTSLFAGNGIEIRLDDPHYWRGVIGSVGYLVSVGLIAFGIGAIVRHVVGGVAITLGVVMVIPIGLGFVGAGGSMLWLQNLTSLLPFNLGRALMTHPGYSEFASPGLPIERPEGLWALEPWQGALGLAVWVVVLFTTAIVLLKRRDA